MSTILPSNRKTKKFLSIVYGNRQGPKESGFLRSYSQLITRHFDQSAKQNCELRKSTASSLNIRTKKNKKSLKKLKPEQQIEGNQSPQTKQENLVQSLQFNSNSLLTRSQKQFRINPQKEDEVERFVNAKTKNVEMNSYENVILNKKLYENTVQKNSLIELIKNLKTQIQRQKRMKAKISLELAKLMNKIEETKSFTEKTQEESFAIKQQAEMVEKDVQLETRKNIRLEKIHQSNLQTIKTERQLVESLLSNIEQNKMAFSQVKTHVNNFKAICMQQSKCLTKIKMNFSQTQSERDNMCKFIQASVAIAKK